MPEKNDVVEVLHEWLHTFMRGQMGGFARFTRSCGLTLSQAGVLFHLSRHGATSGVSEIGDHMGVSSAAASQQLDRLVQQGFIARSEDPDDRRVKRIALTESGRNVVEQAMEGRHRWFDGLVDAMSEEEKATVVAGLRILMRKIKERDPDVGSFGHIFDEKESKA